MSPPVRNPLATIINWLPAGYPDDAPGTGYPPLIALNGPMALSEIQVRHVLSTVR
jgi:hypothetical protein